MTVSSPISWGAILAGAVAALAVSALLTLAAAGLGYTLAAAGPPSAASLGVFTPLSGAVAVAVEVVASALGGYLAGRLRTVWVGLHADESHFRDTAHGFLAWAVATLAGWGLASLALPPGAGRMAAATAPPGLLAQACLFVAVGLLLGAFVAAVAGRLGGLRHEEMHAKSFV